MNTLDVQTKVTSLHMNCLNDKVMTELTAEQVQMVAGGVDWGAVGAGIGAVGLGVAIAATPVGWVGAAGAGLASLGGGAAIGWGLGH